jgi:hypothetical protein
MVKIVALIGCMALLAACTNQDKSSDIRPVAEISEMFSPAGDSAALPYLITDSTGVVHLSWVEKKGKTAVFKFSSLVDGHWLTPVAIASGNNWFVNWADYPMLATDGNKNFIAHYLQKSDTGKFIYDIHYTTSSDNGNSWSPPRLMNTDTVQAEHGFVSIIPYQDKYFACWLDGRKTAGQESTAGHGDGHHGEMSLRGAFIDKDGNKTDEWELDPRVCDCCQTSAAVTEWGPVVIYRDRSEDEIRDISIVRFFQGRWTAPQKIYNNNWKINGCPVNGPRMEAMGNNVAIAWYSMENKKGKVSVVFSDDGGISFTQPLILAADSTQGRVDLVMLDENTAVVSWMEGEIILAVKVYADGKKETPVVIAITSEKRSSGFPQMTKAGDKILFAWTDDTSKKIKVAALGL